ncbi:MAG: DUF4129 domain-containing protein [Herpetosiphon sp.]|nr:DUF4129 domain-containing protein [Herpetosiphon sp.]
MTLTQRIRRYFTPGFGLFTWFLAMMMVNFLITNIVESNWHRGFEPMRIVAFGGCVVAALLARWRGLPAFFAHVLGILLGIAWAIAQIRIDPALDTWSDRFTELLIRIVVAVRSIKANVVPQDFHLFSLAGLLLAWLIGYATIWLLMRRGWTWKLVLFNGALIMANLTYALPKSGPSFWMFMISGLLLVVFETFRRRQERWNIGLFEQQEWLSLRYLWAGLVACFGLIILAAVLPVNITNDRLKALGNSISKPFDPFLPGNSTTAGRGGAGGVAGAGSGQPALANFSNNNVTLGGARIARNEVVLEVRSPRPEYWRSNAWDFYNGTGWENTTGEIARNTRRLATRREALVPIEADNPMTQLDIALREPLTQTFKLIQPREDLQMPAATTPYSWSIPILVQSTFIVSPGEALLPNFTDSAIYFNQGATPKDMEYTVVSLVSKADRQSLRNSSTDYPEWTRRYTQLPDSQAMRNIAGLARQLIAAEDADNPFDKASAIERYLRSLPYDDQIPAPPPGADPIENFLFNLKRGYCDYFAGSMVLMLRTQGIPARWVQGYATGDLVPERGVYVVRDTIAHSWPEVYFVGYGWLRFEPTPAGYVTIPTRPDAPPTPLGAPNNEELGPNGGVPNQPPPGASLDSIQELRQEYADAIPTPITSTLPDESLLGTQPEPVSSAWRWLLLLLVIVEAIAIIIWWIMRRETAGLSPTGRAYALVGLFARWAGIEQHPQRTPREYADDVAKVIPSQRNAMKRLSANYTAEQYSRSQRVDYEQVRNDSRSIMRRLYPLSSRRLWRNLINNLFRSRKREE